MARDGAKIKEPHTFSRRVGSLSVDSAGLKREATILKEKQPCKSFDFRIDQPGSARQAKGIKVIRGLDTSWIVAERSTVREIRELRPIPPFGILRNRPSQLVHLIRNKTRINRIAGFVLFGSLGSKYEAD